MDPEIIYAALCGFVLAVLFFLGGYGD